MRHPGLAAGGLAGLAVLHLGLLLAAGTAGGRTLLWGFHSWTYLTPVALGAVSLAALLAGTGLLRPPPFPSPWPAHLACAIAVAPVLWLFRDTTHLLGDGRLWISTASDTRAYHPHEPLAFAVSALAAFDLQGAEPERVARRLELLNVILGVAAVFILLRVASRLGSDRPTRWLGLGLLLATGATLFGFGYVEAYGLVWVSVLGFVACGLKALSGDREPSALAPVAGAALAAGLAAASHMEGHLLLAGLIALLVMLRAAPRTWVAAGLGYAVPVALAGMLLPGFMPRGQFGGAGEDGSLNDVIHMIQGDLPRFRPGAWMWRQVNLWGLVAPLGLGAIVLGAWVTRTVRAAHGRATWLTVSAAPFALAMAVLDSDRYRGAAADWDVFAAAGPLIAGAAAAWWLPLAARSTLVRGALVGVITAALFGTMSFIALQSHADASVRRFTDLVELSPGWSTRARTLGYETLAIQARDQGAFDRAAGFYGQALDAEPGNLRLVRTRAGVLSWAGSHREAASLFAQAARAEPDRPGVWHQLGLELTRVGEADSAAAAFRTELAWHPNAVESMNQLASLLSRSDATRDQAYTWVEASLRAAPDQPRAADLRRVLTEAGHTPP